MCPTTPGGDPERPGPLTLSVTLAAESGADPPPARLVAGGVLDRDGLTALIHLAHVALRRGCRELVLDVGGLTDLPSALFGELRKLSEAAGRSRCLVRLVGLDDAIDAAVDAAR
jgi:hypothetical protein